ncbi:hypothetical protein TEA_015717 [Camellia sinensis var. sinensis]|uniref:protein phosphatase methylesterase-1 n=1 Tax=Camellia sinensis var. sinensis TaxID=542762 RepID=A0A4S4EL04_CAMSN|nr:hypothetical protein TEA_015717 [Camellia sinensis var. sinensis]
MDSSSNSSTMASLPEEEEEQQHTKQPNIPSAFSSVPVRPAVQVRRSRWWCAVRRMTRGFKLGPLSRPIEIAFALNLLPLKLRRCDLGSSELDKNGVRATEEVSDWVLQRISEVSRVLELSFEGHEEEALRLFLAVEASWRQGSSSQEMVTPVRNVGKGQGELKNFVCSINYDQGGLLHKNTHLWIGWAILTKKMIFTFQIRMMLSFALAASKLKEKSRVVAMDLRGHGKSSTENELDLSIETLCNDVIAVLKTMYGDSPPAIVLVGHSMGGSVAVHVAAKKELSRLCGLIVVDVVEGTAMASLMHMQKILSGRMQYFSTIEKACDSFFPPSNTTSYIVAPPSRLSFTSSIYNRIPNTPEACMQRQLWNLNPVFTLVRMESKVSAQKSFLRGYPLSLFSKYSLKGKESFAHANDQRKHGYGYNEMGSVI